MSFREQYDKLKHLVGSKIKYFKVAGGEPLLNTDLWDVVEDIKLKSPSFKFIFHTNLTFFPKKHLHILDTVEKIEVAYSIDGIGLVNDYIRHDSNWSEVTDTLMQWNEYGNNNASKHKGYVMTAVQAYNFHDLHNIEKFVKTNNLAWGQNQVYWHNEFNLNALPPEYIKKHTNSSNEMFVKNYKFNPALYEKLKQRTLDDDNLLGNNIRDYIPELFEQFNYS